MQCTRCGHLNITSFRFCESCLAPLKGGDFGDSDVIGRFFDDADLLEAGAGDASRGAAVPTRFQLPWQPAANRLTFGGRQAEITDLSDAIYAGLHGKKPVALTVQGEAGSGRSSVLVGARDQIAKQMPRARFLFVSGQGALRPFALIERLLRLRFDIPDYLGGTIAGERFERTIEAFYGDSAGAEVARTCGPMLGFHFWNEHDIDFEDRNEQARRAQEALYNLICRDLADPPTVIVVDDAGEADVESLAFLQQLSHDKTAMPAVIVLATDKRGAIRRPWLAETRDLEMKPLAPEMMAEIARKALTGVDQVDEAAIATIVANANGRPGTLLDEIEHLTRHGAIVAADGRWQLQHEKLDDLVARGDLHSSRGRFDGLSDFQTQVLSYGAIFGQRFWLGGIVAMLRSEVPQSLRTVEEINRDDTPDRVLQACRALLERGLLVPERTTVLPHESGFRLVEEADGASLLELHHADALKMLSHRAAVWLQMVGGERAGEVSEILAPLWLTAGEPVHAAHLFLRAGLRALGEFRAEAARTFLTQARDLALTDDAHLHTDAVLGLGRLAESDGRWAEAEEFYRDALQMAWRFRARSRGAKALQRLGRMFRVQGKVQQALEQLVPALRLYEAAGDVRGLGSICDDIGRAYWTSGNTKPAMEFLKRAAQYRERLGDREGQAQTLTNLGVVSMSLGQMDQARSYLEKAVQMQRERKNLVGLFEALNGLGAQMVGCGEAEAAVEVLQEAHDVAKRVGNRRIQAMIQNNLGEVMMAANRLEEGEALLYKAVEGAGRLADHALLSDSARNLAVAAQRRGDRARALKWAKRSVAAAQSSDVVRTRASSQRTLGEILADGDDVEAADDAFGKAEDWLLQAGEVHELQTCLQAHAAFLVRVGRQAKAEALLKRSDALDRPPA